MDILALFFMIFLSETGSALMPTTTWLGTASDTVLDFAAFAVFLPVPLACLVLATPSMAPSMGAISAMLFSCPHIVVGLRSAGLADIWILPVDGRAHARLYRLSTGAGQRHAGGVSL